MKIQGITENVVTAGVSDLQEPKTEGIPALQGDFKQPGNAGIAQNNQSKLAQLQNSDIPAGLFEMLQNKQNQAYRNSRHYKAVRRLIWVISNPGIWETCFQEN